MPSDLARQYHSITFGDKNTWDDWHLVPETRPVFEPPEVKTNYIDVPGANGSLDVSEALVGHPVYKNREGSWSFYVLRPEEGKHKWYQVYSRIMGYLHGKEMKAVLNDEPTYYYEGRFAVEQWDSTQKDYSHITIKYNVKPFKMNFMTSLDEEWLWDPFNFDEDQILFPAFKNIEIPSSDVWTEKEFDYRNFNEAPICPKFIVETADGEGMDIIFKNHATPNAVVGHLPDGESQMYDAVIFGGEGVTMQFKGEGVVSIFFRNGRL